MVRLQVLLEWRARDRSCADFAMDEIYGKRIFPPRRDLFGVPQIFLNSTGSSTGFLFRGEDLSWLVTAMGLYTRRYFASASDHRVAFDDVAGNLQNELDQRPCSSHLKGALLDYDAFGKLVFDKQMPFQLISGFQVRWTELLAGHGVDRVPDLRTQEDLLGHVLQQPSGVSLSGLSFGSLYVVALFTFAGFPAQYDLESYVDLLRIVPGGLQSSSRP